MKAQILKLAFIEKLPNSTSSEYIDVILAISNMEKYGEKIKRVKQRYKSAKSDYQMFGFYDDCGPSYQMEYEEAKGAYESFKGEYENCENEIKYSIKNFVKKHEKYKTLFYKLLKLPKKFESYKKEKELLYFKCLKGFRSNVGNVMIANELAEKLNIPEIKKIAYEDRFDNEYNKKSLSELSESHIKNLEYIAIDLEDKMNDDLVKEIIISKFGCGLETANKKVIKLKESCRDFINMINSKEENLEVFLKNKLSNY